MENRILWRENDRESSTIGTVLLSRQITRDMRRGNRTLRNANSSNCRGHDLKTRNRERMYTFLKGFLQWDRVFLRTLNCSLSLNSVNKWWKLWYEFQSYYASFSLSPASSCLRRKVKIKHIFPSEYVTTSWKGEKEKDGKNGSRRILSNSTFSLISGIPVSCSSFPLRESDPLSYELRTLREFWPKTFRRWEIKWLSPSYSSSSLSSTLE